MLFLTSDLIPRTSLSEDLLDLISFDNLYKPRKRVRLPSDESDEELMACRPKVHKTSNSDKFEVKLDVKHFRPEQIKVKVIENNLIVEGKHDERRDKDGFVSRQFTRRYELPKDIDLEGMTSLLSKDGKLMIEAPIKQFFHKKERVIPITVEKPKPTTQITLAKNDKQVSDEQKNNTDN